MRTPLRYLTPAARSGRRRGGDRSPRPPQQPIRRLDPAPVHERRRRTRQRRHRDDRMRDARQRPDQRHRPRVPDIRLPVGRRVLRSRADHRRRRLGPPRHGWRRRRPLSHIRVPWPIEEANHAHQSSLSDNAFGDSRRLRGNRCRTRRGCRARNARTPVPNTTQCQTNGSAQIVTSPPANNNYGGTGGCPIIGFGGWGFGW